MPRRPKTAPPLHLVKPTPRPLTRVDAPEAEEAEKPARFGVPFKERITVRIADAIAATGLTRAEIYRAHTLGKLPFLKSGRVSLIRVDALHRYLDGMPVQRGTDQATRT